MKDSVVFTNLMDEYGRLERQTDGRGLRKLPTNVTTEGYGKMDSKTVNANLMQAEERNIGAISWNVYEKYMTYAGGLVWAPVIIGLLLLLEAARGAWCLTSFLSTYTLMLAVGNNLFLGFWTSSSIHGFRQGEYMAVYAGLGGVSTCVLHINRLHCNVQELRTLCFHSF